LENEGAETAKAGVFKGVSGVLSGGILRPALSTSIFWQWKLYSLLPVLRGAAPAAQIACRLYGLFLQPSTRPDIWRCCLAFH
jgi:hypothetical protein